MYVISVIFSAFSALFSKRRMLNTIFVLKQKPNSLPQSKHLASESEGAVSAGLPSVWLTLLPTFCNSRPPMYCISRCTDLLTQPPTKSSDLSAFCPSSHHQATSRDLLYLSKGNVTWKRPALLLKFCGYKNHVCHTKNVNNLTTRIKVLASV